MKGREKSGFIITRPNSKICLSFLKALVHYRVQMTFSTYSEFLIILMRGIVRDEPMVLSAKPKVKSDLFLSTYLAMESHKLLRVYSPLVSPLHFHVCTFCHSD